ncbi:hypothetical protein [Amaricoccus tamworthensis]|uniref:hypothetical protein n=1 Tax=Amaricoccus tamworthensis TaxID=57002 RepID=UPI003C7B939F
MDDIISSLERGFVTALLAASFSFILFLILLIAAKITRKKIERLPLLCLVAFVFGLLALVTGMITGASRNVAVGQVLPASLSLIGAVALYVITKSEAEVPIAATAVIAFSIMLLIGTVIGSYERVRFAAYQDALRYQPSRLKTQADIEFAINGYRRSRGLGPIDFSR